ncbi:alpha/beta fold hydrolase [Pseudomonas sp. PCH446]
MKSDLAYDWLFLAGIGNSGPTHWQRHWEAEHPNTLWLEHRDWDSPSRDEWVGELQQLLSTCQRPVVVVAHSLGCLLLLEWAAEYAPAPNKVLGHFWWRCLILVVPGSPRKPLAFARPRILPTACR